MARAKDKMRYKYMKQLRKIIRQLNKSIENDDLWRGRFVFRLVRTEWDKFPDGSGGLMYIVMRGYDKRYGYYKDARLDFAPFLINADIEFFFPNDFIMKDAKAWADDVRADETDYTKVPVNDNFWNGECNFFAGRV